MGNLSLELANRYHEHAALMGIFLGYSMDLRLKLALPLLSLGLTEEMHEKPTDQDRFLLNLTMCKRDTMQRTLKTSRSSCARSR